LASEDQSCQAPSGAARASSTVGRGLGAVLLLPEDELAVIEPRVTKTMSWGSTWTRPVAPVLVEAKWISETVMVEPGEKDREPTLVSGNGSAVLRIWEEVSYHNETQRPVL